MYITPNLNKSGEKSLNEHENGKELRQNHVVKIYDPWFMFSIKPFK